MRAGRRRQCRNLSALDRVRGLGSRQPGPGTGSLRCHGRSSGRAGSERGFGSSGSRFEASGAAQGPLSNVRDRRRGWPLFVDSHGQVFVLIMHRKMDL